ncbi:unnamed protein product [Triticum aestivum]|nr:uncharacterized protein LOC109742778 [Aegilops tauschii subsp. strangulata]XP_044327965.1 uncharacterized protein LOC123049028 [Triticum aestivum]KAF7014921.1 hypothetical protein CFC21_028846 [Triticum aestivum]SPT17064.1 unnamed protein product [Triticum aestivum]
MAEMVGSLVVGEVVSRTSSFLISKHKERSASASSTGESLERLEMAHIKMEAALEVSARWQVTDVAMLRWRRKLRRAADECDAAVHRWRLRALEEEEAREALARAWLPSRVARVVASFVSSLLSRRGEEPHAKAVQRFEKLADGAGDFLRYLQSGGAPRRCALLDDAIVMKPAASASASARHGLVQGGRQRCLRSGSRKSGVEIRQLVQ